MGFCLFHVSVNCVDSTGWKVLILSRVHFLNDWDIVDCMALDVHDRWLCLKQLPLLMWAMRRTRLEFALEFKGSKCLSRRFFNNNVCNTMQCSFHMLTWNTECGCRLRPRRQLWPKVRLQWVLLCKDVCQKGGLLLKNIQEQKLQFFFM